MVYSELIKTDDNIQKALKSAQKLITHTISDPGLPHPFVPGSKGVFVEQFYWDSFFIMQGLKYAGKKGREICRNMVENMFVLIQKYGYVPNSSKNFTTRSQPPMLTSMILLVYNMLGDKEWMKKGFEMAEKEYHGYWMLQPHLTKNSLSRYRDLINMNGKEIDAENESGWDLTPRFESNANNVCPVDLNSFLFKYETDFEYYEKMFGSKKKAKEWKKKADTRRDIMNQFMWNKKEGFYFDYDMQNKAFLKTKTLAAYATMWTGVADKIQAQKLTSRLKWFEHEGGLSATDNDYNSSLQWNYPNGWPPLMWIVISGLEKYGFRKDVERLAYKWLKLCADEYEKTGEWNEKYCVVRDAVRKDDLRYPHQTWQYWTVGTFISIYNKIIESGL